MDTLAYNLKIIIYFVIIILLYSKGDLNNMLQWWVCLLIGIGCLVVGFVIGFFVIRAVFTKQLKKNPPNHITIDWGNVYANGKKAIRKRYY